MGQHQHQRQHRHQRQWATMQSQTTPWRDVFLDGLKYPGQDMGLLDAVSSDLDGAESGVPLS
jgi:hypothetical protein